MSATIAAASWPLSRSSPWMIISGVKIVRLRAALA